MEKTQINRIDLNILRELQRDARITYSELAKRVGLSTCPCMERVKRMEREGIIRSYSTVLDPKKLNAGLVVFVQIRLQRSSKDIFRQFKEAVQGIPEIQECFLVSGNFDYLIKARVADMTQYHQFLVETLLDLPDVQESTSYAVMEDVKETSAIALKSA